MIAYLEGSVLEKNVSSVIMVNQGIGYHVFVPEYLLHEVNQGSILKVYTHYVVRETGVELYGFNTFEELHFFEMLIKVSGVGPKTALSIFSASSLEKLKSSLARGDAALFKSVSGVGPKTAERIVIELRDKIGSEEFLSGSSSDQDLIDALIALGYSIQDAREALKKIDPSVDNEQERLKAALKLLGSRK